MYGKEPRRWLKIFHQLFCFCFSSSSPANVNVPMLLFLLLLYAYYYLSRFILLCSIWITILNRAIIMKMKIIYWQRKILKENDRSLYSNHIWYIIINIVQLSTRSYDFFVMYIWYRMFFFCLLVTIVQEVIKKTHTKVSTNMYNGKTDDLWVVLSWRCNQLFFVLVSLNV